MHYSLKRIGWIPLCLMVAIAPAQAQRLLTLDSCRAMALRSNKQLGIARLKQDVAGNARKSARTKYLPRVGALGSYQFASEPISLLGSAQKGALSNLGPAFAAGVQQGFTQTMQQLPMQQLAPMLQQMGLSVEGIQQLVGAQTQQTAQQLSAVGQHIIDAFDTDTRHLWAGSVMLTQPIFMGGSIIALNKMADIGEQMAGHSLEARRQSTLYQIDQAYWQVVSLRHKQQLAESYLELVRKLGSDVQKMIGQGVATRSDGLSVDVKVNEAEMTLTKVNDGLTLSRMLLCQLCGLPLTEQVVLADEQSQEIAAVSPAPRPDVEQAVAGRPELRLLENTVELSRQATKVLRAGNLPQVALTGGYVVTNPNLQDGFQRKFGGFWNVGVLVHVPLWNWGDVMYKVRASKSATSMAALELEEAREKIELQVNQNTFRVDEANKKLAMAQTNIQRANENLRMANLGFQEGVVAPATVMEAQTAWLQAQSQKIDAEIDVRLSQVDLQRSLGNLR